MYLYCASGIGSFSFRVGRRDNVHVGRYKLVVKVSRTRYIPSIPIQNGPYAMAADY